MEIDDQIYLTFMFSLVLVFNHYFFLGLYIEIARIGTSDASADEVTN